MTASSALAPIPYVSNIRSSGLTIYDPIEIGDPKLWIPSPDLERLLDGGLRGISLAGLPIRSRSKVAKEHVCRVLGYPIPGSFRKSQPRFPGQIFDTYVQKSNNLQIWNEELSPTRRYVLIRLSSDYVVTRVKVVTGDTLAELDTTGTLTQKYQARCIPGAANAELVASEDTALLRPFVAVGIDLQPVATPISYPTAGALLPIGTLYARLAVLIDSTFILKTSVGGGKSRSCFDRLSTSGIFSAHPTGELPFALSSPRSGRVEGLSCHQQRFLGL
jgi:hypothetical protein